MESSPPANTPERHIHLGKYQVTAHVATGGMGAVYKAVDTETGQEVALKILPPELAAQANKLERFRSEARHGMRLRHKHIVRMFEFGEVNGTYFLVLEFVDGIDLHRYIRDKGRLDPAESCKVVLHAARALDYIHRQGMVHRDIKPANLLLSWPQGRLIVKLSDMGLARDIADDDFHVTKEGTTVGTVDYMAPEQARNSRAADIRSDLYALGCTWYHMLAGHPPFPEGGMVERLYKHLEDDPTDIRELNPLVPEALAAILRRMLAKKPEDRYQTPAELLLDLQALRKGRRPAAAGAAEPVPPTAETIPVAEPAADGSGPAAAAPADAPPASSSSTQEIPAADDYESSLLPAPNPEQYRAALGQYERARQVLAGGNFDYGIHLLLSSCKLDPANLLYRKTLRKTEKLKLTMGKGPGGLGWLTGLASRAKLKSRIKAAKRAQQYDKVLEHGEEMLVQDPWDLATQLDMAEAADAVGLFNLAVWLVEEARKKHSTDLSLTRLLARLNERRGNFTRAIELWEQVRKADPSDAEAAQKITNLAANDTIVRLKGQ